MKKRLLLMITCGMALVPPVFASDLSPVTFTQTGEMEKVSQYSGPSLQCSRNQSGKSSVSDPKEKNSAPKSPVAARGAEIDFNHVN